MKSLVFVASVLACLHSLQAYQLREEEYQSHFTRWIVQNSKNYEIEDFFTRYSVFKDNLDFINNHNAGNHSYEMAVNQFSDLTHEEFQKVYTGRIPRAEAKEESVMVSAQPVRAGGALDWRTRGVVNPVQNQGECGSCYSFSGVCSMEGVVALKTGRLLKLSEQQVVDCSKSYGNYGCQGGLEQNVFRYIIAARGLTTSAAYPYSGTDRSQCRITTPAAAITGYTDVRRGNEADLMVGVNLGPVSIGIQAGRTFQSYSRGVYDDIYCGTQLDHAVNIVGYGTDAATGKDFWIVRNSWSAGWGEAGYIRMARNKNICGLSNDASYPRA
jgi:cathepsin L